MSAVSKEEKKDPASVNARHLADLDHGRRRRVILWSVMRVAVVWALIITVYYLIPVGGRTRFGDVFHLIAGLAVFAALLLWQIRQIGIAEVPEVRAAEALGIVLPIFLILFATSYLSLSHSSPAMFSQRLDHTRALYFTITIFSTVGFGDITPATDTARILVSIQMLLDLAIIGFVVRLLFNAARANLGSRETGSD